LVSKERKEGHIENKLKESFPVFQSFRNNQNEDIKSDRKKKQKQTNKKSGKDIVKVQEQTTSAEKQAKEGSSTPISSFLFSPLVFSRKSIMQNLWKQRTK